MARGQRAIAVPALAFAPTRRPVPGSAPGFAGQTQAGRTPAAPAEVAEAPLIVPMRSTGSGRLAHGGDGYGESALHQMPISTDGMSQM